LKDAQELRAALDAAYHERNQLVAFLTTCYGAHLMRHPETDPWDEDWRWIVCVHTPQGQMTWHIHDSELGLFDHLPSSQTQNDWDGHTTEQKYLRLQALVASLAPESPVISRESL